MSTADQNVLVTGASTGIGRAAVVALRRAGYRVFGTVRRAEDAAELERELGEGFTPLLLDVTDPEAVRDGVRAMAAALSGGSLDALINNAGVALPGPLAEQPPEEIRRMFDVNFFGVHEVTRACLPLLGMRPGHSRPPGKIINVSSGAGKLSIPFLGGYVASKHALEGYSNSLRRELMPFDIPVVVIGPGNVRTPIWTKIPPESRYDHTAYGKVFKNFLAYMLNGEKTGMPAAQIAELLVTIVKARHPKTRYAPVAQKFANWTLPRLLSDRQLDRMMFKALGMEKLTG